MPQPGGLSDDEYKAYTMRALFYEAVGRTIDGFVGAVSRKDPTIVIPPKLEIIVKDATADGLSLDELIKRMCCETILQGRAGMLVDYDQKLGRAYLVLYTVETITNWATDHIVLHETVYENDPDDKFKVVAVEQYRELWMDGGRYTMTVWRKPTSTANVADEWIKFTEVVPLKTGRAFDVIPFFWLTPLGKTSRIEKPPLLGLVNVCLSHYRNSADLEHGRHFTGLPTLYVTGGDAERDGPLNVGSTAAIILSDPAAKVGFVEFNGQGLGSLETALETKEQMMAVLGASVFNTDDGKGVEAAATARIRTSGETSLLSGIVTAIEATVQAALECCAEWMGVTGTKIEVTLNREFIDTTMDGPTLTGLVQAFQAGALSLPQFLYNLQQGDLLAPDTDLEAEALLVEAAAKKKADDALKLVAAAKPPVVAPVAGGAKP